MPSKQETFDTVVAHLRKQGKKSALESVGCAYRGEDGLKCAAGCLIPDEKYESTMEGSAVYRCSDYVTSPAIAIEELGHDLQLVNDLQCVHDGWKVANWEQQLCKVAQLHGITYTPPVPA